MKNKIKNIALGVCLVYAIGSGITLANNYKQKAEMKTEIGTHLRTIEIFKEETEKLSEESLSKTEELLQVQSELDSARQRSQELRVEISEAERIIAERNSRKILVKVTGYCPCEICCGEWAYKNPGVTASGTKAKYGTIAAPTSIPFGTQMYIEGYGEQVFTVEDTGSAVVYSDGIYVIDMWMPTHEQAYAVGNSIVEAIIVD